MTIAISILSSIIAAFLAHYLATARMRRKDLSQLQLSAYADFIGAASRIAVSRRLGNTESGIADLATLNDAKNRIFICGDKKVVEALVGFWQHGSTLESESEIIAFRRLSQVIRCSLGLNQHDLLNIDISTTQFKLEPSSFSFRAEHEKR